MPPFYPPGVAYRRNFQGLQKVCKYYVQHAQVRDDGRFKIHSNAAEHMQKSDLKTTAIPPGIQRLRRFQEVIKTGFKFPFFKKTYFTQQWDKCVIPALAASIVGDDWDMHGQGICEENGWIHITGQAACSTPRQFGKTCNVARTIAAMMEAVPGRREIVCSTGLRISMYVISVIEAYLIHRGFAKQIKVTHPTMGSRITLDHGNGVISEVFGLPDNPRISIFLFHFFVVVIVEYAGAPWVGKTVSFFASINARSFSFCFF